MDRSPHPPAADGFPGPLTPEKVRRARERVAAIHDRIRQRGVDLAQLPDPVEALIKARRSMENRRDLATALAVVQEAGAYD